ncbi:MAG: hypothetical protein K8L99_03560 [Anaerolineae bacterium]|nr:hypothetical protein [Anaerolineae bacterium]
MGILVEWDNQQQTIIRCTFKQHWTWNELFYTLDEVKRMSSEVNQRVDAILDFSSADLIPSGMIFSLNGHQQAKTLAKKASESRGRVVIAGASRFIRLVYETFRNLTPDISTGVYFTDDLAAARRYLEQQHVSEAQTAL